MDKDHYYSNIDALRAIAVIAVITFHINEKWLPSGYLGVDLFFVISGFVITNLICRKLEVGQFSIKEFYLRRIKRILPLVIVVITATLLVSPFILIRSGLKDVALDSIASLLSYMNIWLPISTGGYWGNEASNSLYIHFWSLAVEEQFYLVYPLLFLVIKKEKWLIRFITLFFILSIFIYISFILLGYSDLAFYLTPCRMWQLLAGSLIYLYKNQLSRFLTTSTYTIVTTVLLLSFFFIPHTAYSSYYTIPFTALSFICISSIISQKQKLKGQFIIIFEKIGKISFSLYLWHWLLIKLVFSNEEQITVLNIIIFFLILTTISLLSYRFVEHFFRYNKVSARKIVTSTSIPLIVAIGLIASVDHFGQYKGSPTVVFNDLLYDISPQPMKAKKVSPTELLVGVNRPDKPSANIGKFRQSYGLEVHRANGDNSILLIGDSHGSMWADCLKEICINKNISMNAFCGTDLKPFFTLPPTIDNVDFHSNFTNKQMLELNLNKLSSINSKKFNTLILCARWSRDQSQLAIIKSFVEYASKQMKVLIIAEPPSLSIGNSNATQYAYYRGDKRANSYYLKYNDKTWHQSISLVNTLSKIDNVYLFKPEVGIYDQQVEVIRDSIPVYFDDDHLSRQGTMLFYDELKFHLEKTLSNK